MTKANDSQICIVTDTFSSQSVPLQAATRFKKINPLIVICSNQGINTPKENSEFQSLSYLFWFQLFFRLKELRAVRLFHAHHTKGKLLGALLSIVFQKPLIITMHNPVDNISLIHRIINRVVGSRCHIVVMNSISTSNSYTSQLISDKKTVIYNGIDFPKKKLLIDSEARRFQRIKNREVNLIILGRVVKFKRVDLIIQNIINYSEKHKDYKINLKIVGEVVDKNCLLEVMKQVIPSNLAMEFLGLVDRKSVYECLDDSDLYLNYSTNEGFCNALVESLVMGLDVLVPDIEVFRELNVFGGISYFDSLSETAMEQQLSRVIANRSSESIKQQQERAEQYRKHFSIERSVDLHCDLYSSTCNAVS